MPSKVKQMPFLVGFNETQSRTMGHVQSGKLRVIENRVKRKQQFEDRFKKGKEKLESFKGVRRGEAWR
jgi:hypothetical protein